MMRRFRSFIVMFICLFHSIEMRGYQEYLYAGRTTLVKEFNPESSHFRNVEAPRVVEFYSPHCPACIEFSSHYIEMAESTKKVYPEIQFFGVSCDQYEDTCEQYGIQGYPTIRLFQMGDDPTSLGIERDFETEDSQESTPRIIADLLGMHPSSVAKKEGSRGNENSANHEKDGSTSKEKEALNLVNPEGFNYDGSNNNEEDSKLIKYNDLYKTQKEQYIQKRRGFGKYIWKDETKDTRGRPIEHAVLNEMTNGMRQNTPGTTEFLDRKQAFYERIEKSRTKHKFQATTGDFKKESLPYAKGVTKPKWLGIENMSQEEELILDTTLSLTVALETGLSMGITDTTSKLAMKNWLNLLSVSLPPEWSIHKLIDHLRKNFEYATRSTKNFKEIIHNFPLARNGWSPSCRNQLLRSEGFSCGFWKLLHIITLGVAEQRGGQNLIDSGMMIPTTNVFAPSEAADTIRNYIDKFFTCRPCREHFLSTYDDCNKNRRCKRLTSNKSTTSPADWKELSLWLWEFHNDVSVRLVRERISKTYTHSVKNTPTIQDEVSAIWPNVNNCIICFENDGTWNRAEVFRFLEHTYWPDSEKDPLTDKLLAFDDEGISGSGLLWLFVFVVVGLVYKLIEKRNHSIHQSLIAARLLVSQGNTTKSRIV